MSQDWLVQLASKRAPERQGCRSRSADRRGARIPAARADAAARIDGRRCARARSPKQNIGVAGARPRADGGDHRHARRLRSAIPVRIYVPHDAGPDWIVWYHGGGGVIGSIDGSGAVTRYLAAHTRLHGRVGRLPARSRGQASRGDRGCVRRVGGARRRACRAAASVAVGGDSFGGFLSVHVDQRTRDAGMRPAGPPGPGLSGRRSDADSSPSIERYAEGYLLTKTMMHWFRDHYLNSRTTSRCPARRGSGPTLDGRGTRDRRDGRVRSARRRGQRLGRAPARRRRRRCATTATTRSITGFISLGGVVRAARAALDEICAEIVEMLRAVIRFRRCTF